MLSVQINLTVIVMKVATICLSKMSFVRVYVLLDLVLTDCWISWDTDIPGDLPMRVG